MNIENYFKDYFKTRWVGWYLLLGALLLALIGNITYRVAYSDMNMQRYFSVEAYAVVYVTIFLGLAVSAVRPVAKWAALVVFALTVCSFCLFVNGTYMYLSSVFFAGLTAEAFKSLNGGFVATVVFYVLTMIVSLVALFIKTERAPRGVNREQNATAVAQ